MGYRTLQQVCALAAILGVPFSSMAQEEAPAGISGEQVAVQEEMLAPEQLADLVAPVALYPDPLLSQVLVASTYPLEVVEAQQWLQRNGRLRGQQLTEAARQQSWDASVQGLVAFPDVLATLNENVRWTTALGDAFLAQQADVMAAVQRMRARAQANGKLTSTPQQTVTTETQGDQAAIEIAPADPQVIYVPEYDPADVWGPPAWDFYPPLEYSRRGFGFGPGIDIGFCFGGWGGWNCGDWGWGPNWFGRSVFVNGAFFRHHGFRSGHSAGWFAGRQAWRHDPGHRLGVSYTNGHLTPRYQPGSMASRRTIARSGSWNRLGSGATTTYGNRSVTQGARSAGPWNVGRAAEGQRRGIQGAPRYQVPAWRDSAPAPRHFAAAQRESAPAPRYSAPAQRHFASVQRESAPAPRYSAPAQRYFASVQRESPPAPHYRSAPRMSAPGNSARSFGGGGGSRVSSGSGGARITGGGHSSVGGAHRGDRRQ